ncbi:MAG TPA: glycosyltransferase [Kofleriaceae bacterium]|nr:glycosyltransferase [Kofleriaceae bacterium]
MRPLDIVFLGLSITSAWGNAHAAIYRGLVRELTRRGHRVLFLERDLPWYATRRDLPRPPDGTTALYRSIDELRERFADAIARADVVVIGSFVPDGREVASWVLDTATGVVAFYDIDTPVTLSRLGRGVHEYISPELVPRFDLYLSLAAGPTLGRLEREYGARRAVALHSSVDPDEFHPPRRAPTVDLGYVGSYNPDRQVALERFLMVPARHMPDRTFLLAGPGYPAGVDWPGNLRRLDQHLPPREQCAVYGQLRYALNRTRSDMIGTGFAPSRRVFEAAACGTPVVTDRWPGLDSFFKPGREILVVESSDQVEEILRDMEEEERSAIGERARQVGLERHTNAQRAGELERVIAERRDARARQRARLAHVVGGVS